VIGSGKYCIRPQYKFEIPQTKWFTMSKQQRMPSLQKFDGAFLSSSVRDESTTIPPLVISCTNPSPSQSINLPGPSRSMSDPPVATSHSSQSQSCVLSAGPSGSMSDPPVTTSHSSQSQSTVLSAKLSVLSSKLGLPTAAIERIAKKAADILQTEGAIVSAPGQPVAARMVVSHSGKRPHLVLPKKKSGGMSCDDDCPQYKSAKLCSLTVAAAESNKQLDQFIASYQGMKIPYLTRLVVVLTHSVFTTLLETLVYVMAVKGNTRSLDLLMISAYNTKSGTHSHLEGQTLARVALQMFTTTVVLPVSWLFGHLLFIMHCGSR